MEWIQGMGTIELLSEGGGVLGSQTAVGILSENGWLEVEDKDG